jgi:streptogramin lyase
MIRTAPRAAVLFLAVLLTAAGAFLSGPAAGAASITEFLLPHPDAEPVVITAGPGGALWFSEADSDKIARITTAGVVTNEFAVPGNIATELPTGVVEGPDGNLWFSETESSAIGRLTPAGVGTQFNTPTLTSEPLDITPGPDGALWFTEFDGNNIGRITTAGVFKEFPVPTADASPTGITTGPDGNLWFTEENADRIGRLTPQGAFKEFPLPHSGVGLGKIVTGPDHNLWFTEITGNRIGRITTAGTVTEFNVPTSDANPAILTPGPDGNLWFTEFNAGNVGRITTAGVITEIPVPSGGVTAGITAGPDGNLWFTEPVTGEVGRINLGTSTTCTPGATTLCIDDQPGDQRWQVTASYHTAQAGGLAGNGNAIPLASLGVSHGGLFWFFGADNPEMLIKVLNACAVNQRFWIYASATTNVAFTLTVTDTRNGRVKTYSNPDGKIPVPVQDTSAFTCTGGTDVGAGAPPRRRCRPREAPPPSAPPAPPASASTAGSR